MSFFNFLSRFFCHRARDSERLETINETNREIIATLNARFFEEMKKKQEELKSAYEELQQSNIELENKTEELEETNKKLKEWQERLLAMERMRILGELSSGVAHDLNNILTVVSGRVELLLQDLKEPQKIDSLKIIQQALDDGAKIVHRLFELAKGKTHKDFSALDLNTIIQQTLEMTSPKWKSEAKKKGIKIETLTELNKIPPIMGNASELRELLTNLILNAVEAMPEGGTLTIKTAYHWQVPPGEQSWVEVSVIDTGVGVSEEIREKIFEPFFSTKERGSGLGLNIVQGIIAEHKGKIFCESEEGDKGTKFTIKLPALSGISESKKEELVQSTEAPAEGEKEIRILVIDDDLGIREILFEILSKRGWKVQVADSSRQALDLLEKGERFEVVFCDLSLPEISGTDLARKIKTVDPRCFVSLLTGWSSDLNELSETPAIDYVLTKPCRSHEVYEVVEQAQKSCVM
ncbi:MAG: ATP-binding protein [Candidatus Edwardsbacteria bacterium]